MLSSVSSILPNFRVSFLGYEVHDPKNYIPQQQRQTFFQSKQFKDFCLITSQLPTRLQQIIISQTLPQSGVISSDPKADCLIDVIAFSKYSEFTVSIDIIGGAELDSFYTGAFTITNSKQLLKWSKSIPIKKLKFCSNSVEDYPQLLSKSREVIYQFDPSLEKDNEISEFVMGYVSNIHSVIMNVLPPFQLLDRCENVFTVEITISEAFRDFDQLYELASTGKRIVVNISTPTLEFLLSHEFQSLLRISNMIVKLYRVEMPLGSSIVESIKHLNIEELHSGGEIRSLSEFRKVKSFILHNCLIDGSSEDFSSSCIKTIICRSEKLIELNFNQMRKLKSLFVSSNISKQSFESIPDTVTALTIYDTFSSSAPHFGGELIDKLPVCLRVLKSDNVTICEFIDISKCRFLTSIQLAFDVNRFKRFSTDMLWKKKQVPSSVDRLELKFNVKFSEERKLMELTVEEPLPNLCLNFYCENPGTHGLVTTSFYEAQLRSIEKKHLKNSHFFVVKGFNLDLKFVNSGFGLSGKFYLPINELGELALASREFDIETTKIPEKYADFPSAVILTNIV
ncbi:unnamed protein product [Ambrosiozyma monospora]|uniref:Unnamed protein product n=1 Tax=Ambrosiozyma monospora TaxID=43982 RepID=A0A9W6YRU1_AMBMO|nr:unnamed protein product [Ambrosiozyma monospora]